MQLVSYKESNTVSLRFAILASLDSNPQTGYEIAREFDSGVGNFWRATHQQIYRELSKLSEEKLVEFEQIQQDSKPAKKRYEITALGHDALAGWLSSPTPVPAVREPLLVKLSAGSLADKEHLLGEVLAHRAIYAARLQKFKHFEATYHARKNKPSKRQQYLFLTLRRGITAYESWIQWSEEVLTFLRSEQ